jgi:hypothetical protein
MIGSPEVCFEEEALWSCGKDGLVEKDQPAEKMKGI